MRYAFSNVSGNKEKELGAMLLLCQEEFTKQKSDTEVGYNRKALMPRQESPDNEA